MARVVHIALKCADTDTFEKSTKFYEEVFGIYRTKDTHDRGHRSRHMTDGNIDLALMVYDSENEKEAQLSGPGACIHHIGIEVEDRPSMIEKIESNGGRIFSDRAEGALKYFSPDGTLSEIVGIGRYKKKDVSKLGKIVHVAIKVSDLDVATKFYENVFDFKQLATTERDGHFSRHMTDGDTDIALLYYRSPDAPEANLARSGPCIHHWGIEVPDRSVILKKIVAMGGTVLSAPDAKAIKFRGPDGNICEVVNTGRFDEYKGMR